MIPQDQLRIDGQELNLEERIAYNFQGPNLADLTELRESYTHTIEVPASLRNEKILGFPSDPATDLTNLGAYKNKKGSIYIGGALMIKNGKIIQTSAGDKIRLNVVGTGVDLWSKISGKSIKELTWGNLTSFSFTSAQSGADIIFPIMESWIEADYSAAPTKGSFNCQRLYAQNLKVPPFVRKRALLENILSDAGYTLNYNYLRLWAGDERIKTFENSYLSMLCPAGKRDHTLDPTIRTVDWFHDVDQADIVKGILYQLGAMLHVDGNAVYLTLMKEIMGRKNEKGLNWSGKLDNTVTPVKTYDIGYARSNRWQYENWSDEMTAQVDDFITEATANGNATTKNAPSRIGFVGSDNANLEESRIVGEIPWKLCPQFIIEDVNGNERQVCYLPSWDASLGSSGEFTGNWDMVEIVIPDTNVTYNDSGGTPQTWSGLGNGLRTAWSGEQEDGSPAHITNGGELHGLSFDKRLIPYFYDSKVTRWIREPLQVEAVMNLTVEDIRNYNNVDSFSKYAAYLNSYIPKILPVFIQELNGWFIVTKIQSYTAGEPAKVTLVRI